MYKFGKFNFCVFYVVGFWIFILFEFYVIDIVKKNDRLIIGNLDLKLEKNNYFLLSVEYVYECFLVLVNVFYNNICDMIDYNMIVMGDKVME